jgi:hypothetical protein
MLECTAAPVLNRLLLHTSVQRQTVHSAALRSIATLCDQAHQRAAILFTFKLDRTVPTLERNSTVSTNRPEAAMYSFCFL